MSDFPPQGPPSGPPSGPPPGGPPFGGPPPGGAPPLGPPGGGNELGGDFGTVDDGVRLLKRAQTLVPMFFKRNMAAVKVIAALSFVVMLIEFMCIFLSSILGIMEMYEIRALWKDYLIPGVVGLASIVIGVVFTAALRVGRQNMFEGVGSVSTLGGVLSGLVPGLLGAGIGMVALFIGSTLFSCCIVPGVIAFIPLCWAPWLLAARGEPIGDGFTTAIALGQKYWAAALGLLVANVLLAGILSGLIGGFGITLLAEIAERFAMGMFADPTGAFIGGGIAKMFFMTFKWICIIVSSIGVFAVTGGIMSAMEEEYYGEVVAV